MDCRSVKGAEEMAAKENAEVVVLAAQIEADINELETFEERQMFLEELGLRRTRSEQTHQKSTTIYCIFKRILQQE